MRTKRILLSAITAAALTFPTIVSAANEYAQIGTDYSSTKVDKYTQETSLEALDTVNMILGFIKGSNTDKFINKGYYKALFEDTEKAGSAASSTSTTNTTTEKLVPMILNVTRAQPTTEIPNPPMYVQIWLDVSGPNDLPMRVIGNLVATQGVSSQYPLGQIVFNYEGYNINNDGTTGTTQYMRGVLKLDKATNAGQADVKYFEEMSTDNFSSSYPQILNMTYNVSVDTNSDGVVDSNDTQGVGTAFTIGINWNGSTPNLVAYDVVLEENAYKTREVNLNDYSTGVYAAKDATEVCKTKDPTKFFQKAYEYKLFNSSTGAKVTLNGGMPIKKGDLNGYASYWGIWSEGNVITNGDTVTSMDGSTNYTVKKTLGKLIKHTKSTMTLADLKGLKLSIYTTDNNNNYAEYVISWNTTNETWDVLGTRTWDTNGVETITATTATMPSSYNSTTSGQLYINEWTKAWCNELQTEVPVILTTPVNTTTFSYHYQEVVQPTADMVLLNYGYEIINPAMATDSTPAVTTAEAIQASQTNSVIGHVYNFDYANGVLVDLDVNLNGNYQEGASDNANVIIPASFNFNASGVTHNWWQYGAQIGPLIPVADAGSYNGTNFWTASDADLYYTYETGNNDWNVNSYLLSGTTPVVFDKPLNIKYTHTTASDLNGDSTNDGKTYMIQYDGNNLGLPWVYDETNGWSPTINIAAGVTMGDTSQYVVKPISIGTVPPAIDISNCTGTYDVSKHGQPASGGSIAFIPLNPANGTDIILEHDADAVGGTSATSVPTAKPTASDNGGNEILVKVIKGVVQQ